MAGFWQPVSRTAAAPANLTPWAREQIAARAMHEDYDTDAVAWCLPQGLPFNMERGGPLDIRIGGGQIAIVGSRLAITRHIYLAAPEHPDPDVFDFTAVGDSRGRWASDGLDVDTVSFNDGYGPEGAPRTESAHLTEHFRLLDGGRRLEVASTWADPKVFATPYSYTLTYERMPSRYVFDQHYCDPRENGVGYK